ncbi:MAG: hypothetical protein FWH27_17285, partial [Planctomycetaceae bacterium]|nr:hypothetical protein [Planctomycetaceae bacterium]
MSTLIEIINRICRKYPRYVVGGFCLTGLCFGAEFFTGTFDRQYPGTGSESRCDGYVTDGFDAYESEFRQEQAPLCGHGVTFFDEENQLVRKVDSFTFDPSNPAGFEYQTELLWTEPEPKRLQFRFPGFASQDAQPQELLQDKDTAAMMVQASETPCNTTSGETITSAFPSGVSSEEPYPTRFASTGAYDQSPGTENQMPVAQQYVPVANMPYDSQPVNAQLPNTTTCATSGNSVSAAPITAQFAASQGSIPNESFALENTAQQIRQDNNTVQVAMRWSEDRIDSVSTSTGDLYVTREQLDEVLNAYETSQKSMGLRKGPFTFMPYGFINICTSYESSRTTAGDFALYSRSPDLD